MREIKKKLISRNEDLAVLLNTIKRAIEMKIGKDYDPEYQILADILSEGDVTIDIGAAGGDWTHFLWRQVGSEGKIFAFEADPYQSRVLKNLIYIMRMNSVKLYSHGLGRENRNVEIVTGEEDGDQYAGRSHIISSNRDKSKRTSEIDILKLDNVAKRNSDIMSASLIKMDIEGYEMNVSLGAENVIEKARPIVISEMGYFGRYGYTSKDFINFYRNKKYIPLVTDSSKETYRYGNGEHQRGSNCILVPEEKMSDNLL